ncbi:hypothetical protein [Rothia nasimurium]|uniref:hypothetical protein n=1 Tax=Rothia nasimurium TaxID=85336 RepID=UPI001F3561BA|nr:hypothetical protein [Rothia nasimurium]
MSTQLSVDELRLWWTKAGFTLEVIEDESVLGDLYLWVTEENQVVYIGSDKTGRRWKNELRWKNEYLRHQISSGFLAMVAENNCHPVRLSYARGSFNSQAIISLIDEYEWNGSYIDSLLKELEDGWVPSFLQVEEFLIRVAVRGGKLIANTAHASLWETCLGRLSDTMAAIVVNESWDEIEKLNE